VCLPAIAKRLPIDVQHVYFYFMNYSCRRDGRFNLGCGMPRIEIMRASIAAAVFILRRLSSRGETPPPKRVECLLRLPSIFRKEKSPMQKRGEGVHPPPPTHNFACSLLSSPPKQIRWTKRGGRGRSGTRPESGPLGWIVDGSSPRLNVV
jgi:hypothetical protein